MKPNKRIIQQVKVKEYVAEEEDIISGTQLFLHKNKTIAIAASIVIVVVIALFFYMRASDSTSAIEASVALSRIVPFYKSANYEVALKGNPQIKVRGNNVFGLIKIIDDYSSTSQGKLAALYAGNCYFETGKYNEAISYYKIALGSSSNVVKTGAYAGIGASSEALGNFSEASENYENAANLSVEDGSKFRYQYYAGLCFERGGDSERAIDLYREIVANNKYSEFLGKAKSGLVRLGTIIE